jgi:hypothetical protein
MPSTFRRWWIGFGKTSAVVSGGRLQYFGTVEPQKRRRPALPRRDPGHHPAGRAAGHHRRDLPPGVVATPRPAGLHPAATANLGHPGEAFTDPDTGVPLSAFEQHPTVQEAQRLLLAASRRRNGTRWAVALALGFRQEKPWVCNGRMSI